jgi:hypothetical protein
MNLAVGDVQRALVLDRGQRAQQDADQAIAGFNAEIDPQAIRQMTEQAGTYQPVR